MYTDQSIERARCFLPIQTAYDIVAASDRGDLSLDWKNNKDKWKKGTATPVENACLITLNSNWKTKKPLEQFAKTAQNRYKQKQTQIAQYNTTRFGKNDKKFKNNKKHKTD